jgi:hypothetical protein
MTKLNLVYMVNSRLVKDTKDVDDEQLAAAAELGRSIVELYGEFSADEMDDIDDEVFSELGDEAYSLACSDGRLCDEVRG